MERRKKKRHLINTDAVLMIFKGNEIVFSERIIDVSQKGLAFSYYGWADWENQQFKLDILDAQFYIESLPIRIASDTEQHPTNTSSLALRRCGVEFLDLSGNQSEQMDKFINRYILRTKKIIEID